MTARYIIGDVFGVLATLEPDSVDLIFSSPPFLALRSYLPADHDSKHLEIGSEATPADFLDTLLDIVEACDRVLAPHGSLCFELGDTYAGSSQEKREDVLDGSARWGGEDGAQTLTGFRGGTTDRKGEGWPLAKSLCLIPTLFAASLAYGHNMLRPERTTPRWRVRNQVVWARPNPPVGALGDKYRPATSYVTVATKSAARYFDLDAVREPGASFDRPTGNSNGGGKSRENPEVNKWDDHLERNPAGAPPLDYWVIPTHPYPGAHYATFPPELVVRPVKSMCPQRVCRVCGEPSRRITETQRTLNGKVLPDDAPMYTATGQAQRTIRGQYDHLVQTTGQGTFGRLVTSESWSDCGHDDWRPGVVLDPFAGSGTTLAVATGHGRDAIGIDLDDRNADLALDRVGPMFLTIEHLSDEGAA